MENVRFGGVEIKFADIVWKKAPVTTRELISICEEKLNWKRTTTYTVLKKFCERGIFKTENSVVYTIIEKEDYYTKIGEVFLEEGFSGSLPAFIAAFSKKNNISETDFTAISEILSKYKEEK